MSVPICPNTVFQPLRRIILFYSHSLEQVSIYLEVLVACCPAGFIWRACYADFSLFLSHCDIPISLQIFVLFRHSKRGIFKEEQQPLCLKGRVRSVG
jgi:hypothetical protein